MLARQTPVRLAAPRENVAPVARWWGAGWSVGLADRDRVWGNPFLALQ